MSTGLPLPMLDTSRESDGYDGIRGNVRWWFEAWGTGSKAEWTTREEAGRPPTPKELINADYIVFGFQKKGSRRVQYKTRAGGLDLRKFGHKKRKVRR